MRHDLKILQTLETLETHSLRLAEDYQRHHPGSPESRYYRAFYDGVQKCVQEVLKILEEASPKELNEFIKNDEKM